MLHGSGIELNHIIGACSLGTALVFLYVATYAWRDARAKGGPLTWPLHGRYVIFLLLLFVGLLFLNSSRLWLSGTKPDWTWFLTFNLESRSILSMAVLSVTIWFTKRWRAGTLLTMPAPKAHARGLFGIRSGR
jgi:hypothetical protein